MKFVAVAPDEIDNTVATHRGRVSYPIIKEFLESGIYLAELDKTGIQQSYSTLFASVTGYARRHHLPVKMFSRGGKTYFMRLDVDKDGNEIPDWENLMVQQMVAETEELTPELVTKQLKSST